MSRIPTRSARAVTALLIAVLATGCGAGPQAIGESGVDGLTIPTPSPMAADFASVVDNPWLPLSPGATWAWQVRREGRTRIVTDTVHGASHQVAGVATTVVERVVTRRSGAELARTRRFYAQDVAGNVWLFGEEGGDADWLAGTGGAQAGLAMPARPRLGDGWPLGLAPGVFEDVVVVTTVSAEVTLLDGSTAQALVLQYSSALAPVRRDRVAYVRDEGPVRTTAGDATWTLLDHRR